MWETGCEHNSWLWLCTRCCAGYSLCSQHPRSLLLQQTFLLFCSLLSTVHPLFMAATGTIERLLGHPAELTVTPKFLAMDQKASIMEPCLPLPPSLASFPCSVCSSHTGLQCELVHTSGLLSLLFPLSDFSFPVLPGAGILLFISCSNTISLNNCLLTPNIMSLPVTFPCDTITGKSPKHMSHL